jgi:glucosamine-6-phosphate deaminase
MAPDAEAECRRYEAAIRKVGGLDLLILGIGANGHIGFNEPTRSVKANTHRAKLAAGTRRSNADLFGGRASDVPREALSMGVGTILRSREIVLIATGAGKSAAIRATVDGPITSRVPASFLQLHGNVELVLDSAAAGGRRRYRRPDCGWCSSTSRSRFSMSSPSASRSRSSALWMRESAFG